MPLPSKMLPIGNISDPDCVKLKDFPKIPTLWGVSILNDCRVPESVSPNWQSRSASLTTLRASSDHPKKTHAGLKCRTESVDDVESNPEPLITKGSCLRAKGIS